VVGSRNGLSRSGIAFFAAASRYGVNFQRTFTIGRQQTVVGARALGATMREGGICVDRHEALHILMEGSAIVRLSSAVWERARQILLTRLTKKTRRS
jgi:hypothetical protein